MDGFQQYIAACLKERIRLTAVEKKRSIDGSDGQGVRKKSKTESSSPLVKSDLFDGSEPSVGITEFLTTTEPWTGLLKSRYSDFVVAEIGLDGNVCSLTPEDVAKALTYYDAETSSTKNVPKVPLLDSDEEIVEYLGQLVGVEEAQKVVDWHHETTDEKNRKYTLPKMADKGTRTAIHKAFRACFPDVYETSTENGCIAVKPSSGKTHRRNRGPKWPKDRPDYLVFTLKKENMSCNEAMKHLSRALRISQKRLEFAGTKDKRGVTTQLVSVKHLRKDALIRAVGGLSDPIADRISVGKMSYRNEGQRIGSLKGNRFTIILRNVRAPIEHVRASMDALAKSGFINYFGLQRFGTGSVPTHHVGKALISKQWQKAVDLILQSTAEGDREDGLAARRYYAKTKDAKTTLQMMPRNMFIERDLLQGLQKEDSPHGALNHVPPKMRTMYTRAYQSFVWNNAVSFRIQRYGGERAVVGDLVVIEGDEASEKLPKDDSRDRRTRAATRVRPLTEEDVASSKWSITDVVLPLPGGDVVYPGNEVAEVYTKLLEEDGITHEMFVRGDHIYRLPGGYRKILEKAGDLHWEILRYDDPIAPLPPPPGEGSSEGALAAVAVSFSLSSSTYATMCLRECMKVSSSSQVHKALAQRMS